MAENTERRLSFSAVNLYDSCPYAYYLNYKLTAEEREACGYIKEGNYYAENGSLVHDILAGYFTGDHPLDDLSEIYADRYESEIYYTTRPSIMAKTYECCANYFATTELEWTNEYDVAGVELRVETEIKGIPYIGYIDLLLKHKQTGDYWLIDHKSSAYPFKKSGNGVLAKEKENFEAYKKQMYLYCYAVKEIFGRYPSQISWNHFKEGKLATISFDEDEYNEAVEWFTGTVECIKTDTEFEARLNYFRCHNLCDYRNCCEYKSLEAEE